MINKGYLTCDRTTTGDEVLTPRYAVYPIIHYLKEKCFCEILCPFDKYNSLLLIFHILQQEKIFLHIQKNK